MDYQARFGLPNRMPEIKRLPTKSDNYPKILIIKPDYNRFPLTIIRLLIRPSLVAIRVQLLPGYSSWFESRKSLIKGRGHEREGGQ